MDQEIKAQWVAALRSGEFTQGTGALHDRTSGTYCCLGVLCVLAERAGAVEGRAALRTGRVVTQWDEERGLLPVSVQRWSGIPTTSPMVATERGTAHLAWLNDHEVPFQDIANLIEEQF